MKSIIVFNRKLIQFPIGLKHIVISMSDDKKHFPNINPDNCLDILRLEVFDWDGMKCHSLYCDDELVPDNKIYNSKHAKQVLNFVFKYLNDIELIVSQCDAGISRSSGTAGALSKIINRSDEIYFKPPYYPNMLIYRTILNEYFENKESYRTKYNLSFPDYL